MKLGQVAVPKKSNLKPKLMYHSRNGVPEFGKATLVGLTRDLCMVEKSTRKAGFDKKIRRVFANSSRDAHAPYTSNDSIGLLPEYFR
jgi:hypothetical protein